MMLVFSTSPVVEGIETFRLTKGDEVVGFSTSPVVEGIETRCGLARPAWYTRFSTSPVVEGIETGSAEVVGRRAEGSVPAL